MKVNEVDASIHDGLPDVLVTTCLGQTVELSAGSVSKAVGTGCSSIRASAVLFNFNSVLL